MAESSPRWAIPTHENGAPVAYPREAVLSEDEVARALEIDARTLAAHGVPCSYIGRRKVYVWGQIIDWLTGRAA